MAAKLAERVLDRVFRESTTTEKADGVCPVHSRADEAPSPFALGRQLGNRFERGVLADPLFLEPRNDRGVAPACRGKRRGAFAREPAIVDDSDLREPSDRGFRRRLPNPCTDEPLLEATRGEIPPGERASRRSTCFRGAELAPQVAKERSVELGSRSKAQPDDDLVRYRPPRSAVELEGNVARPRAAKRRQPPHCPLRRRGDFLRAVPCGVRRLPRGRRPIGRSPVRRGQETRRDDRVCSELRVDRAHDLLGHVGVLA
jgi:hypothetical protein